jgi:transposase-like protein
MHPVDPAPAQVSECGEVGCLGQHLGNGRNGYGHKTVVTDTGKLDLQIPRDRQASFDPQLIAKYQRRFPGFDDKVISMYARGMSTREIVGHLRELYGIEVSPDLISAVTVGRDRGLASPPARAGLPADLL